MTLSFSAQKGQTDAGGQADVVLRRFFRWQRQESSTFRVYVRFLGWNKTATFVLHYIHEVAISEQTSNDDSTKMRAKLYF